MLFFGHRKALADEYEKWLAEHPEIKDCPINLIGFLVGHSLIDEEKAMEFIKSRKESEE